MNRQALHTVFMEKAPVIKEWFSGQCEGLTVPIYASMDLRESSYKTAPVDANVFPAGFNNICEVDRENAPEIFKSYIDKHYGSSVKRILLLAEVNTKNLYYWDNVATLQTLLRGAGFQCEAAVPEQDDFPAEIQTASGKTVVVQKAARDGDHILLKCDYEPDLVINNNDFSTTFPEFVKGLSTIINPPYQLGWYKRKKDRHFHFYNQLATELAKELDVDPWFFNIKTNLFQNFEMNSDENREGLAEAVQGMVDSLKSEFLERQIESEPLIFVKSNSGTYGMGVTQVSSGEEIIHWNNRSRKKMKQGKGGNPILELILQEGIPSDIKDDDGMVAEPVMYMVGFELVGGFLRSHTKKGTRDNLNSPGAIFKRLCTSDLKLDRGGSPMENVYGVFARIAQLAICHEAKELEAPFPGYKADCSSLKL